MSDEELGPLSREADRLLRIEGDDGTLHDRAIELLESDAAQREYSGPRLLAQAYLERGRLRDVVRLLTPLVQAGRVDLAGFLATMLDQLGKNKKAEAAYRVAVDSGDVESLNDYAVFLRDRGRFDEAEVMLRRGIEVGDDYAAANLVLLHLDYMEDAGRALELGERYLSAAWPKTFTALAQVYRALGRLDDAEGMLRRAVVLPAPQAHIHYAEFLEEDRRDLVGAEREFRAAKEADEPRWSYSLGSFLLRQGRRVEARAVLEHGAYWDDLAARELLDEEFDDETIR